MNELLHTILLRVTLAGAASAAALRMAGSGAMRETVRLAAGLLMLAALYSRSAVCALSGGACPPHRTRRRYARPTCRPR